MKVLLLALAALAIAAPATAVELITNGSFETTSLTTKGTFAGHVTGWTGGTGLSYLDFPGTADGSIYLAVYGPFPKISPDGGNFVEIDADHSYGAPIMQTINGLVAGRSYSVSFYQAAGQQQGYTGPTTERWDVSLGTETHSSSTFSLAQGGVGLWKREVLTFTATGTSEVLKFLATGTPSGKPPISFLDGVSMTDTVPEPATWALMLGGFGLVGAAMRRRATSVAA